MTLVQFLAMLDARVDHLHVPLAMHPDVPLQVHGRYTRIETLASFGIGTSAKIAAWQGGVYTPSTPTPSGLEVPGAVTNRA